MTSVLTSVTPARNVGCGAWPLSATASNAECSRQKAEKRENIDTSIMSGMQPTRRQLLSTLAAASAATLVEPGDVLARLAADVPCTGPAPAGELLGTLPL